MAARERVHRARDRGRSHSGRRRPGRVPGLEHGAYIRPTIFADVDPDSTIAQEEIFGPVLSVIPYADEEEAVAIADGTVYGLTAAVFGEPAHAMRIARQLKVGQVYLNGADFNPAAPFGGYKQSGNGRELGRAGVEEFTELKAIQV
ncbi:aldehyde dehydrogenase family protein [Leifsonia sp. F6_8S_P_1B]|uniref:Aldehyde dehydrogenase family protein n=1 Tax=Leifsonia williamsii TaxID=3035919 RepID=A0ABT8KEI8_9MICO|nr:aldehyde dehydrogenase family protein [Leifsonia williamsii]MDN4615865.1 aldehyde dehydrogenase family protein [Leifsonia williamsii]